MCVKLDIAKNHCMMHGQQNVKFCSVCWSVICVSTFVSELVASSSGRVCGASGGPWCKPSSGDPAVPTDFCISYLIHLLLFCTKTNKCTQLFHKLSHCYMFRHYPVILRQPVINTLPSYTSISNAAVGNTVYN